MKKVCFIAMVCIFVSSQVFAGPIFDHSKQAKNPELLSPPIDVHPDPKTEKPTHATGVDVTEYLSSVVYYAAKNSNKPQQSPDNSDTKTQTDITSAETLAAASAFWGPFNSSNDTSQDAEPSVTAIERNGYTYTTTVYIKYVNGIANNYFSSTYDFSYFNRGQLPLPAGYTGSGDPLLAQNPYTYGISPGRIYASGIIYDTSGTLNGIALWRSDAVGWSWYTPTIVANNLSDPNIVLDKPAVAVSWHSGSDLGYVYVAWIKFNKKTPTNPNETSDLYIATSTDGGTTFGAPRLVASGGIIQGPQIVVNYYYGRVYVLWTDFSLNAIRLSGSDNCGQTWTAPETGPTGNMASTVLLAGGIRALSMPMARFNHAANRICVVWHEYESGTYNTDVYYSAKSPSGWLPKRQINDDPIDPYSRKDQFMPALDFDASGNLVVTFYDRRNDPSNRKYDLYMARIDSNGNPLDANRLVSTFQSDPQSYTDNTGKANFIGDYQDVWSQPYYGTEYYLPAWIGIPPTGNIGDTYLSIIQP